jgi:hypothetical protein
LELLLKFGREQINGQYNLYSENTPPRTGFVYL